MSQKTRKLTLCVGVALCTTGLAFPNTLLAQPDLSCPNSSVNVELSPKASHVLVIADLLDPVPDPETYICTLSYGPGLVEDHDPDPDFAVGEPVKPLVCNDVFYPDTNGVGIPIRVNCEEKRGDGVMCFDVRVTVKDVTIPKIKVCATVKDTDGKGDGIVGNIGGKCYATVDVNPPAAFDECMPGVALDDIWVDIFPPLGQDLFRNNSTPNPGLAPNPDGIDDEPELALPASQANRMYGVGTTTLVWTVKDKSGNVSEPCTSYVRVEDREPPVLTCPLDPDQITLGGQKCEAYREIGLPTWTDNCLRLAPECVSDTLKHDNPYVPSYRNATGIYSVNCGDDPNNPLNNLSLGKKVTWTINDCATKQRDLVLAIDVSSSIIQSELDIEADGLKACLEQLPQDGSLFVAIVTYGTEAHKVLETLTPVNAYTRANIFNPILDGLTFDATQATNIGDALIKSRMILAGGANDDFIILIGDGDATIGPNVQDECVLTNDADITICSIAIGDAQDLDELTDCADATGGQTCVAADFTGVRDACVACFESITQDDPNEDTCSIHVKVCRDNPPTIKCNVDFCVEADDDKCSAYIDFDFFDDHEVRIVRNPFVTDPCIGERLGQQGMMISKLIVTHKIISRPAGTDSFLNRCGCFDDSDNTDCDFGNNCLDDLNSNYDCDECDEDATGRYPVGMTVIEWKVTNPETEMSSTCQQKVTVIDTQPPKITCTEEVRTVETDDGCNKTVSIEGLIRQLTTDDPSPNGPALDCTDNCEVRFPPEIFVLDPGPNGFSPNRACSTFKTSDLSFPLVPRTDPFDLSGKQTIFFVCKDQAKDCDGNDDPNYSEYVCCIVVIVTDGLPCPPDPEPDPTGACCDGDDCTTTTEAGCTGDSWTEGGVCDPNPCTTGTGIAPPPPPNDPPAVDQGASNNDSSTIQSTNNEPANPSVDEVISEITGTTGGLCAPSNAVSLTMMLIGIVAIRSTIRRRRRH